MGGNGTTTELSKYSFLDQGLTVGKYQYRLKQIDYDGSFEYSKKVSVEISRPFEFSLEQNYPNPFNPSTTIQFSIPSEGVIKLTVLNIIGEEIETLVNEYKTEGTHQVIFNAENIPSGIYFYKLDSGSFTQTRKMILIK